MKEIKVLGSGCAKCLQMLEIVKEAVSKSSLEVAVVKVTDIEDIIAYGVMMTPALVYNEEVKISGKLPSVDEVLDIIKED